MRHLALLFFLFILSPCVKAQGLSISSVDTTTSVCYNDGSITVHPSGGTPLYTYTIISGPAVANVSYPISGGNNNTFADLHAGTYVVQVTDAAGHTVNVTVTVPGNYQFPIESLSVNGDTVFSTGSLGKPPYRYAISDSSLNGPFGTPQSGNAFPNLCNGTYYIRIYDACQNFFTESITLNSPALSLSGFCQSNGATNLVYGFVNGSGNPPYSFKVVNGSYTSTNSTGIFNVPTTYPCPDTISVTDFCHASSKTIVDCYTLSYISFCSNFSDSTGGISVTGGSPPLTYTFYEYLNNVWVPVISQDSGNFSHLPYDSLTVQVMFGVKDACGRNVSSPADTYLKISASAPCPFNDTILVTASGAIGPPISFTCLSCSPVQTNNNGIFVVTEDTSNFTFRVVDGCGESRDTTLHVNVTGSGISAKPNYISCNGVQITATSSTGVALTSGLEYVLYVSNAGVYDSVTENSTGLFEHLPNGNYQVKVIPPSCSPVTTGFFVPYFDGYCATPFFDQNCKIRLIVQYGSPSTDLPENYSLIDSIGNKYNEYPQGGGNGIYFNVPPGNYTLVSDSGCSVSQRFAYNFTLAESHTHSCLNASNVTLGPKNPYYPCINQRFVYILGNADTSFRDTSLFSSSVTIQAVPPGVYLATVSFLADTVDLADTLIANGNSHCVLDTLTVRVEQYNEPIISAKNVNVCGANSLGDIPFAIIGGFPPYIVSIFGQATTTTNSNSGVLNNIKPDSTYTIRVSDSCGISSTYSVSVIDTCNLNNCSFVSSNFVVSDSSACSGQTLSFQNDFTAGTTYQWTANGNVFSTGANPAYQTNATGNIIFKCVITFGTHCKDSSSLVIQVDKTPVFNLGSDTAYCGNFTRVLSTGVYNTHWSTNVTDSAITVSAPGTYRATVSNACGQFADSVTITANPVPVIHLVADTTVCTGDSAVLNAFFPSAVYQWSNASTTSSITVSQSGLYVVTVTLHTCSVTGSTHFSAVTIVASQLLPADTTLCSGSPLILKPTTGINAVWQDGTHDSIYNVTHSGTYSVTVLTVCGTFTDSSIVVEHATPVVNLGHDSLLCNGDSIGLNAFFPNSTYKWSTGSTASGITVNAQDKYSVTVNSFGCIAVDSVSFDTASVSHQLLPDDTTICEGTSIILTPKAGTNPVWQDGSHGSTYTVTASGLYTISVATICGEYSDSINVVVDVCPSNLHVADAFTPNGDGVNDHFTVYGESIEDYEIKIFDRWGEKVYDSRDVTELNSLSRGWDGTYKGKLQDPAAFAYIITAKGYDGKDYFKKGYVILIR